jgi:hypothetical protein
MILPSGFGISAAEHPARNASNRAARQWLRAGGVAHLRVRFNGSPPDQRRVKVPLCSKGTERSQPWVSRTLPFMR